ncbi:hypothetical protein EYF80_035784 [Liparis tanakae]|uniref:Uncharacterized protein n=1 Tax=Liparis tanakae TaxID=230148 RepID=A0A4Z2GKM5_9TELE|nr:hypothetical protein EYF80_035784 [Liparis tanakae]
MGPVLMWRRNRLLFCGRRSSSGSEKFKRRCAQFCETHHRAAAVGNPSSGTLRSPAAQWSRTDLVSLGSLKLLELALEAQVGASTGPDHPHCCQRLLPAQSRHRHDVSHHQACFNPLWRSSCSSERGERRFPGCPRVEFWES